MGLLSFWRPFEPTRQRRPTDPLSSTSLRGSVPSKRISFQREINRKPKLHDQFLSFPLTPKRFLEGFQNLQFVESIWHSTQPTHPTPAFRFGQVYIFLVHTSLGFPFNVPPWDRGPHAREPLLTRGDRPTQPSPTNQPTSVHPHRGQLKSEVLCASRRRKRKEVPLNT